MSMMKAVAVLSIASMASIIILMHDQVNDVVSNTLSSTGLSDNPFDNCILPDFDPWDYSAGRFANPDHNPLWNCNKTFKPFTAMKDGVLQVLVKEVNCSARCVFRKTDWRVTRGPYQKAGEKMLCDIVEAYCHDVRGVEVYRWLHAQIHTNYTNIPDKKPDKYSVHVILLDSASGTQVIRSMPRTVQYFEKSMQGVMFPHLNKVGMNSAPNAVALFFGFRPEWLDGRIFGQPVQPPEWHQSLRCKVNIDNLTFIMSEFRKKGYRTLFAEDWVAGVMQYPGCKGWTIQPTDHYMKPYQVAKDHGPRSVRQKITKYLNKHHCIESHKSITDYVSSFINAYTSAPIFSWIWLSELGHDFANGFVHSDGDFHRWLRDNRKELDNSFVIFLGDHGLRFGSVAYTKLGRIETNNPLFMMSIPKDLRENTDLLAVMKENSKKLQTHHDVRATLHDILYYQPDVNYTARDEIHHEKYGGSVLRHQIAPRSCKTLPIPLQFCICQYPTVDKNVTSDLAIELGKFLIESVNKMLDDYNLTDLCVKHEFEQTQIATTYKPEEVSKTYRVTAHALPPTGAVFHAVIRKEKNGFSMSSDYVDRRDRYYNTGDCAGNYYRHLCYCKIQPNAKGAVASATEYPDISAVTTPPS